MSLAVKKAEDGDEIIVRLVELDGKPQKDVRITFASPITAAREVNGQEEPVGPATVSRRCAGDFISRVSAAHICAETRGRAPENLHQRNRRQSHCITTWRPPRTRCPIGNWLRRQRQLLPRENVALADHLQRREVRTCRRKDRIHRTPSPPKDRPSRCRKAATIAFTCSPRRLTAIRKPRLKSARTEVRAEHRGLERLYWPVE